MLILLLGKDWTSNSDHVFDMIARDVASEKGGRILMVPELISHDTERRLCMTAGDTASRFAEVLSFTRLARRVADSVGHAAVECMDKGGRIVAMAAAARQLHSKLKAYASVETRPEFLTGLVDAVDEFKRCCISADDLMQASKQTEGSLAQKLEELSLLLEAYDSLCSQGKRDPRDQMSWLLEQLEDSDFGENHVFYIDGFPDFTRQHMAILEHLIRVSPKVVVSLNCDDPGSKALAFEKAGSTALQLLRCAQERNVKTEIITVAPKDTSLYYVKERLFQGSLQRIGDDHLQVYRTQTVYEEAVAAAEKVLTFVQNGARYRDVSIVCSDISGYRNTLQMVFRRCAIPLYLSGTEDILEKTVISTVLYAMDAALGGFEQGDVLRYLKSVLSPLDLETCDQVENYAVIWGISGTRWQKEWVNHPEGLEGTWDETSKATLAQLNAARKLALDPMVRLRNGFLDAVTVKQQIEALYAFLEELQLSKRLVTLADELDSKGDNRGAQILNQLWEILLTAIEQIYDTLGNTAWDADTFTRLFKLLLSQYDVGTIPPVLDAVICGPVSAVRCHRAKHLIVLGALEGALPGYSGSSGVLTDQERTALRALGVPLTGGAMEGLQAEFAEIYGVFCGAQESITVSCPSGQPSFVYRRLCDLAGGESKAEYALGAVLTDRTETGAYFARLNSEAAAQSVGVLDIYHDICSRRDHTLGSISKENIKGLYGPQLNLSASQIDRQADCRFSYFLKYGLRARERKSATVDPAEFGTYVHAVLEETAREVMDRGGFHKVSLEETLEFAEKYSVAYAAEHFSQIDSQRIAYLFRRNKRELDMVVQELWQELSQSSFEPVDFEVAFGEGQDLPAIAIRGKNMDAQLRGFVDRVDSWKEAGKNFFRIVDYKTGKKDFDYCDVFNGLGLQMLLYLFAMEQEGQSLLGEHAVPAGVQYFPARAPLVSADGQLSDEEAASARDKLWKRSGLLLAEEDVLQAMEPGEKPVRMAYIRKKDGSIGGDIADREQLKMLKKYILHVLCNMVDDIASGNIEPNPYTRGSSHNPCGFCPYGSICHAETVEGRRNYKTMSAQRFWEAVEKEVGADG